MIFLLDSSFLSFSYNPFFY